MAPIDVRTAGGIEVRPDRGPVERRRDPHRNSPRHIPLPAGIAQIVGDRGESVVLVAPDVGIAVAVAIGAEPQRDGRHELRIAGCSRVAAFELPALDALVHQPQRRDELFLEERSPAALISEAGKRLEKIEATGDRAVAGLLAVDRDDHRRIDAVKRLDAGQVRPVRGVTGLAAVDQRRGDVPLQIRPEVLNVIARGGGPLGAVELHDPLVGPQIWDNRLNRRFTHALGAGERRQPQLVLVPPASSRRDIGRPRVGIGRQRRIALRGPDRPCRVGLRGARHAGLRRRGAERHARQPDDQPALYRDQRNAPHDPEARV